MPQLVLQIGDIQPDDTGGMYRTDTSADGVITDYKISNRFERDTHTYMAGLTSPNPHNGYTVGMVRLSAPTLLWICSWTGSKAGAVPPIPDPEPSKKGAWVLLDQIIYPTHKTLMPDGVTPMYRISGVYIYAARKPHPSSGLGDVFFPNAPWVDDDYTRKLDPSKVIKNLIDDPLVGPAGFEE